MFRPCLLIIRTTVFCGMRNFWAEPYIIYPFLRNLFSRNSILTSDKGTNTAYLIGFRGLQKINYYLWKICSSEPGNLANWLCRVENLPNKLAPTDYYTTTFNCGFIYTVATECLMNINIKILLKRFLFVFHGHAFKYFYPPILLWCMCIILLSFICQVTILQTDILSLDF